MKAKIRFLKRGHSIDYETAKYWVDENLYFNIDLKFLWNFTKNCFYNDNNKIYLVDIPYQGKDWSYIRFEGENGYYVIPTCDYKIENYLREYDIVKIIDTGFLYPSYYEWVEANVSPYKKFFWTPKNNPNTDHKFKVITIAPWKLKNDEIIENKILFFIEDIETKECFLIDERGIAFITDEETVTE